MRLFALKIVPSSIRCFRLTNLLYLLHLASCSPFSESEIFFLSLNSVLGGGSRFDAKAWRTPHLVDDHKVLFSLLQFRQETRLCWNTWLVNHVYCHLRKLIKWLDFFPLLLLGVMVVVFGELGEGKDKKGVYVKKSFKLEKLLKFPKNVLTQKLTASYDDWNGHLQN